MSEADVQVAPDSTGARIKTYEIAEPQPVDASGNAVADFLRNQQVISLADRRGDAVDVDGIGGRILVELQAMRELLEAISLKLE